MRKIILLTMLLPVWLSAQQGAAPPPTPAALTTAPSKQRPMRDWLGQHDDVAHFYGSFFLNEAAYQIQGWAFPKWKPSRKILIANAFTVLCISAKERFDMFKKNPTEWSWDDWLIGLWAIPIYNIVRICLNDWRSTRAEIYTDPIDPMIKKRNAPRKWSLKRQGFLN